MSRWGVTLALAVLLLAGCPNPQDVLKAFARLFPTIGDIEISRDTAHRDQPTVTVAIHDPENTESHVFVEQVFLSYRSTREAELPFIEAGTMTEQSTSGTTTTWQGQLPPLNLGPYEVRVQALMKHEPQDADDPAVEEQPGLFLIKTQPFNIGPSPACFAFASSVEDWTLDGIRDIQTSTGEPDGQAEVVDPPSMTFEPVHLNGAALMSMGQGFLPGTEPASGMWAIDFVSPDLSQADDWQDLEMIVFRISSDAPVQVQPILVTQDADGVEHMYAPGTPGNRIFYDVSSPTRTIEWSFSQPEGSTTTALRIRVFVEPGAASGVGVFCRLHDVCPTSATP